MKCYSCDNECILAKDAFFISDEIKELLKDFDFYCFHCKIAYKKEGVAISAQATHGHYMREYREKRIKENYTKEEWLIKKSKCKGICPNCNLYVGEEYLTLDHIIPISKAPKGFIYTINDIQPLCISCNVKKNNKVYFREGDPLPLPLETQKT